MMIDHFEIKVIKFELCVEFYSLVLSPLSIERKWDDRFAAGFGLTSEPKTRFLIEKSQSNSKTHIAFSASTKASVNSFHSIGLLNGYTCNGLPRLRKNYAPNYFAAFLLDPDGNNIEAVVYL